MATKRIVKIKTETANGRTCHTRIFLVLDRTAVVINRRILAKQEDLNDGWFPDCNRQVRKTENYTLVQQEIVFFTESFDAIIEAYNYLTKH